MARVPRGLIGVVHVPAMPGDPGFVGIPGRGGFRSVVDLALSDADALLEGGAHGIIVENFGSAPFPKGSDARIPPHQIALLTRVTSEIVSRFGGAVGVNCLRNDVISALGIAAATGASFVRVNVHTGAYVTDQGLIEGDAHTSLRYRHALGLNAEVAILADVLVKHATPLAPVSTVDATRDTLLRGRADGVIVTGSATGGAIDLDTLRAVREAAGDAPVVLGSGTTPANAAALAPLADAAIVGTWLKRDGVLANPVDAERVREMKDLLGAALRTESPLQR